MELATPRSNRSHLRKHYAEIRQFARRIVELYEPEKIILFGSYAYGSAKKDSDVDLLVIMNSGKRPVETAFEIRNRISCPFALDLMVRSLPELKKRVQLGDYFLGEILEKGQILYERTG
jgi:uncharacterized protein